MSILHALEFGLLMSILPIIILQPTRGHFVYPYFRGLR